jgi:chromosome partitioning protein
MIRTIVFAATKGGVGKTTLSSALAVRAAQDSKRVAMIDLDPQGSLRAWWGRRGEVENPRIFSGVDTVQEAAEVLEMDGWDWLIVDTPPSMLNTIEPAIEAADLVVIPVKPSAFDLEAVDPVTEICQELGKPYVMVVNDAEPRWKLTQTVTEVVKAMGHKVLSTIVMHRQPYVAAVTVGKSGPEVERDAKKQAASEIDGIWAEIKRHVAKAKRG